MKWFKNYEGREKYTIPPINTLEGRLLFNENLWGPSPKCLEVLKLITNEDLIYYDLRTEDYLLNELSKFTGIPNENIFLDEGSSEVLKAVFQVILEKGDNVLIPKPGWGCYVGMINACLCNSIYYRILEGKDEFYHDINDINKKAKECRPKIIIITTPQMPTGNIISAEDLETVIKNNPESLVVVDECYHGLTDYDISVENLINKYENVLFVRTLSKIFGLANLRIGYGITNIRLKELIDYVLPLHKLPQINRKVAIAAIQDIEYYATYKKELIKTREWFCYELNNRNYIKAFKSHANFIYAKFTVNEIDVNKVQKYMEERKIMIRLFENCIRITIAPKSIMERVIDLLDEVNVTLLKT